jgi:hypothetical protein
MSCATWRVVACLAPFPLSERTDIVWI